MRAANFYGMQLYPVVLGHQRVVARAQGGGGGVNRSILNKRPFGNVPGAPGGKSGLGQARQRDRASRARYRPAARSRLFCGTRKRASFTAARVPWPTEPTGVPAAASTSRAPLFF